MKTSWERMCSREDGPSLFRPSGREASVQSDIHMMKPYDAEIKPEAEALARKKKKKRQTFCDLVGRPPWNLLGTFLTDSETEHSHRRVENNPKGPKLLVKCRTNYCKNEEWRGLVDTCTTERLSLGPCIYQCEVFYRYQGFHQRSFLFLYKSY